MWAVFGDKLRFRFEMMHRCKKRGQKHHPLPTINRLCKFCHNRAALINSPHFFRHIVATHLWHSLKLLWSISFKSCWHLTGVPSLVNTFLSGCSQTRFFTEGCVENLENCHTAKFECVCVVVVVKILMHLCMCVLCPHFHNTTFPPKIGSSGWQGKAVFLPQ